MCQWGTPSELFLFGTSRSRSFLQQRFVNLNHRKEKIMTDEKQNREQGSQQSSQSQPGRQQDRKPNQKQDDLQQENQHEQKGQQGSGRAPQNRDEKQGKPDDAGNRKAS
jgi:hypothetical protein